jgi:hypothetical protein
MTEYHSEDQIERIAERQMDNLDQQLLKGILTNEEYNQETLEIERWVRDELRLSRARQYREW